MQRSFAECGQAPFSNIWIQEYLYRASTCKKEVFYMKYEQNYYLTHDGSLDVEFLFLDLGQALGWRAYIISDINYKTRLPMHRLTEPIDENKSAVKQILRRLHFGFPQTKMPQYICWSQNVYELEDIREVAKSWTEITAYYIKHGGNFADIQKKLAKKGIISF